MQHAVWRSAACVYDNRTNVQSAKGEELAAQVRSWVGVRRAWALAAGRAGRRGRVAALRAPAGERALTLGRDSLPAGPLIGGNRGCPDQTHAWPQPRPVDACRRTGVDAGYFST